jgi:hypothetical protein
MFPYIAISDDVCINFSIGSLEDNPSVEGEGKAEGQRT